MRTRRMASALLLLIPLVVSGETRLVDIVDTMFETAPGGLMYWVEESEYLVTVDTDYQSNRSLCPAKITLDDDIHFEIVETDIIVRAIPFQRHYFWWLPPEETVATDIAVPSGARIMKSRGAPGILSHSALTERLEYGESLIQRYSRLDSQHGGSQGGIFAGFLYTLIFAGVAGVDYLLEEGYTALQPIFIGASAASAGVGIYSIVRTILIRRDLAEVETALNRIWSGE